MIPGRLDLSFSSQNCNSLNLSTLNGAQTAKIVSILNLDTDIIFLSDTRMNGKHKQVEDSFRLKYKMYHNSLLGSRGVAILIRNNIFFEVLDEERDEEGNALVLRIRIRDLELVIGSVYGPNNNEFRLYDFLQELCMRWRNKQVILGGDWNATYSDLPVNINPDVFSMQAVPSFARTARILQLCEDWGISDPYRGLNPGDKDFTYVPSGLLRRNRSRIDFFLISDDLRGEIQMIPESAYISSGSKN